MSTEPMTSNSTRDAEDLKEATPFYEALSKALKKRKIKIETVCPPSDPVSRRILEEYGAIYVANKKVTPPPVCIFTTEEQVTKFQDDAGFEAEALREVAARGHKIEFSRDGYGGYQAIRWDRANRVWVGASESRKDGQAAGY